MVTLKTLDLSIVSFIVLIFIFSYSYNRVERIFAQYKLFNTLVILNMSLIIIDLLGWAFNGLPGSLNYYCNLGFNLILYIAAPMIPSVWVIYTYYLVYNDKKKVKRIRIILIILVAANALVSVLSLFTGSFFSVDAANIYHRGPLFSVHIIYNVLLLGYSFVFIIANRKSFQKRHLISIMHFYIAPLAGTIIQTFYYGVSYNWTGVTISLLIIFINFQSRNLSTDYLTGVNNRMHFHGYIKAKIHNASEKRTFGVIMIDIDNFKEINDNFGHAAGDDALKDTVSILRQSLRRDDFIARFGGDEFFIVIDVQTITTLEDTIKRIEDKTGQFNAQHKKPYKLSFSLGYDVYDIQKKMKPDEFVDHLDKLMYEDKKRKNMN